MDELKAKVQAILSKSCLRKLQALLISERRSTDGSLSQFIFTWVAVKQLTKFAVKCLITSPFN